MTRLRLPRATRACLFVAVLAASTAVPHIALPTATSPAAASTITTTSYDAPTCRRTLPAYPVLEPGDRGPAVRTLQCALNDLGVGDDVAVDGWYGPQTRRAVATVEAQFEGEPRHPGRIGNGFWTLLHGRQLPQRVLRQGDRGHTVVVLQRALRAAGGDLVVDGDFGAQTRRVVLAYQHQHQLGRSGRITESTRLILAMGGVFGDLTD